MASEPLDDGQLFGHHRGVTAVEVQPVPTGEPLVGEGRLTDLARADQGQESTAAAVDDLLIELAQQSRADAQVAPVRVEGQHHQVSSVLH